MTKTRNDPVIPAPTKDGVQETLFPVPAPKKRRKESRQRNCMLLARVSPEEKRQITKTAKNVHMSVSEYVRYVIILDQRARAQAQS